MNSPTDLTALVAVFDGVPADQLRRALGALEAQTRTADRVIVVADGPLTRDLESVLVDAASRLSLHVVRLDHRVGSGPARNAGLEQATTTWVAIVDADDESLPCRFEKQLEVAVRDGLDMVGAAMDEFDSASGRHLGVRRFPSAHEDIVRSLRLRNVVNHPTVLLRRECALRVGGYRDLPLLEDYDLCARMVHGGAVLGNLPESLVRFRGGVAVQRRRRAREATVGEWRLQRTLARCGVIPRWQMPVNWLLRTGYRVLPLRLLPFAYGRMFLTDRPDPTPDPRVRPGYDHFSVMAESRGPIAALLAKQVLATTAPHLSKPAAELDVLDVGSGYGHTAAELAAHCRSVTGLEPASTLHESAVRSLGERSNLRFVQGTAESLPPVPAYDLVVLDNVYEHLPDRAAAMAAISRVLRPGGVLYLVVPNKLWPIEAHYHLPFLAWLPLRLADAYLRATRRGVSYADASYAPTYWSLRRQLLADPSIDFHFVLPGAPEATVAGSPLHYRLGMAALRRAPALWVISKALLVVAVKRSEVQSSPSENADSRSWRE